MRLFFFICLLALVSCRKAGNDNTKREYETKINNDLVIIMIDRGTGLTLRTSTQEQFECSNFPIIYTIDRQGTSIIVHYRHVLKTSKCLTASGPATAYVELGKLEPGDYALTLKCNGKEHSMPLSVSDTRYTLKNTSGRFFTFHSTEAMILPENLLWGYAQDNKLKITEQFSKVLNDSLANCGASPFAIAPGGYWGFMVNGNGETIINEKKGFLYKYTGDFNAIKRLMNNYRARYKDSVRIVMYNSKQQTAYSWIENP